MIKTKIGNLGMDKRAVTFEWWSVWKAKPQYKRHQWALNPFMQGFYWVATFILAAAASLFSDEIKAPRHSAADSSQATFDDAGSSTISEPGVIKGGGAAEKENVEPSALEPPASFLDIICGAVGDFFASFSIAGYTFFFLALVSALFFGYTAWVKSLRENFIYHTMQTNPPLGFWERFEEAVLVTRKVYDSIQEKVYREKVFKKDLEECELGVRAILDHIINLVMIWDTANIERKVVYRANVMDVVYFSESEAYTLGQDINFSERETEESRRKILNSLDRFLHQPMSSHYSGVVVLNNNRYTTTTETGESSPDETIKPIVLPFCLADDVGNHKFHSNLRGAPYSVATGIPDYVETVTTIISHYSEHADPNSQRIRANLKKYYSLKGNPAQSILSMPLRVKNESEEQDVRWVLNIYRNQPGMLYNQEKNKQFTQIISSLTSQLEVILDMIDGVAITPDEKQSDDVPAPQVSASKVEERASDMS